MAGTRVQRPSPDKTTVDADIPAMNELIQSAQKGTLLGVGVCSARVSGCYDVAKELSAQFLGSPTIFVTISETTANGKVVPGYQFVGEPILPKQATAYQMIFFTGCALKAENVFPILYLLGNVYDVTNIKYVYTIHPPQHASERHMKYYESNFQNKAETFKKWGVQLGLMHLGLNVTSHPNNNIGIPRVELKTSDFDVPVECYGLIRFNFNRDQRNDFFPVLKESAKVFLTKYFQQVTEAGRECERTPIKVIALGVDADIKQIFMNTAAEHSIVIDFYDRLPLQADFFKILAALRDKGGIVALDCGSTMSFLQTLSLGVFVIVHSFEWHKDIRSINHSDFYQDFLSVIPKKLKQTAMVILGLSKNYELLKNTNKVAQVHELWHKAINTSHERFEALHAKFEEKPGDLAKKTSTVLIGHGLQKMRVFAEPQKVVPDEKNTHLSNNPKPSQKSAQHDSGPTVAAEVSKESGKSDESSSSSILSTPSEQPRFFSAEKRLHRIISHDGANHVVRRAYL